MMKFGANVTQTVLKGLDLAQLRSCFEFEIYLSGFAILFSFKKTNVKILNSTFNK